MSSWVHCVTKLLQSFFLCTDKLSKQKMYINKVLCFGHSLRNCKGCHWCLLAHRNYLAVLWSESYSEDLQQTHVNTPYIMHMFYLMLVVDVIVGHYYTAYDAILWWNRNGIELTPSCSFVLWFMHCIYIAHEMFAIEQSRCNFNSFYVTVHEM